MELTSDQQALINRFTLLEENLNDRIFERPQEIKTAIVAIVAKRHHFQQGQKGVAKSLLVRELFASIGEMEREHLFQILLTPYTTPEELFGIPSLKAMDLEDRYVRNTEYKLSRARIALLDELFNASSSNLNTLLTIMNERLFFNGGPPEELDLGTIFGASNIFPSGNELEAFYDRLHFRHMVNKLQDRSNFIRAVNFVRTPPEQVVTWSDILTAQSMVQEVTLPPEVVDTLVDLRDQLNQENIEVSDRRYIDSLDIIRTTALLNGRLVATTDDLRLLRHVFWSRPEEAQIVSLKVMNLANPTDMKALNLSDEVDKLRDQLEAAVQNVDSGRILGKTCQEVSKRLIQAKAESLALLEEAIQENRKTNEIEALRERIESVGHRVMEIIG